MAVAAVVVADLDALVPLFAGYLQFYQVPRSASEIHAFLLERLQRGDAQLFQPLGERDDAPQSFDDCS